MIEYLVLTLVLVCFTIASIEDIKKREVYDYINYSLVFFILIISIFHSFMIQSLIPVKYVGFGLLIGFLFGSILFYSGIWGGGDAKFLIGFSASVFYLLKVIPSKNFTSSFYSYATEKFNSWLILSLDYLLKYILILDVIFMFVIIVMFFFVRKREDVKNLINLFSILFLLFIGLYLNYDIFALILIGFFVFVLIFFGNEDVFSSVYFKIKKKIVNLNVGDKIDSNILFEKNVIVSVDEGKYGISNEDINKISGSNFSNEFVNIRKVLPYAILIGLNYFMYMIKIITLDEVNLSILGFLSKFLFYSFICGGVLAIGIIFFYYLRNFKKIEIKISIYEKVFLSLFFILIVFISFFNIKSLLFLLLIFAYLFIKIAKSVESLIFVKKKNIDKIVLGDWIAQDIYHNGKLIYSAEDFKLGINEKQLERLKHLSKENKHLKSLHVKDGLAFIPPLFVGFLILLLL